jgi:ceramide glucosyltransferase
MFSSIVLAIWSGAGLAWWVIALRLVARAPEMNRPVSLAASREKLSIFKPLPPLGDHGLGPMADGLESFVAQLDFESELLLGIHEADRSATAAFLDGLRSKYPNARVKATYRSSSDDVENPKIAWLKILARESEGTLWLWSDADITASSGFLQSARNEFAEFARRGARMVTFPYMIKKIPSKPALLEALFVNADFYPGVLLLAKRGPVDFGLGAAMLFRRDDFERTVDWNEIGGRLADDFFLGQKLRPVRIGSSTLTTFTGSATWNDALAHDLRWSRTIRWNRPGGFFARMLVLPVLGWLAAVALHPAHFFAWGGLVGMVQADVLFATAICNRIGCRLTWRNLIGIELWSVWRVLLWVLSWLPLAVKWSGKSWKRPIVRMDREISMSRS